MTPKHIARYRATEGGKAVIRRIRFKHHLKVMFGLTVDQFETLLAAQGGVCAICGRNNGAKRLHVDHDHVTGKVRGLLCFGCNTGMGGLQDDPALMMAAAKYILDRR